MATPAPVPAPTPVTIAQFRLDFPAFTNTTIYPDAMVQWNITWATNLMNATSWGNMYTQGMELLVAHLSFLNAQQNLAAAAGGAPGIAKGLIASESAGAVSLGYDTLSATEERGGSYNLTQWGQQFIRLARLVGMGPVQVGIGYQPWQAQQTDLSSAYGGPIDYLMGFSN